MAGELGGPNPFYTNPAFGAGLGNLAQAFLPNPQRAAYRAHADLYDAQAGTERLRAEQLRDAIQGGRDLSGALAAGLGADPANAWRQIFGAAARGGPRTLQAVPGMIGGYAATQAVPEAQLGRIVVGAGGDWRRTEGGARFVEGEETRRAYGVTDRQQSGAMARERVQQGGAMDRERLREAGADRRWTQVLRPGDVAILPPDSPGAPAGSAGPVRVAGDPRPQTFDQARAQEVGPYLRGEGTPGERDRRRAIVAPSVAGAEARAGAAPARPGPPVNASAVRVIGEQIDAQSTDADGAFRLEPQARQWIGRRAAQLYQTGDEGTRGNAPEAVAQAMAEFLAASPPRTDTRLNPMSDRGFGLPQGLREGTAGAAPPAARDQPAPREGRDVVLPGGRVIREGAVVVQGGQRYVARSGRMVPVDPRGRPAAAQSARPGA